MTPPKRMQWFESKLAFQMMKCMLGEHDFPKILVFLFWVSTNSYLSDSFFLLHPHSQLSLPSPVSQRLQHFYSRYMLRFFLQLKNVLLPCSHCEVLHTNKEIFPNYQYFLQNRILLRFLDNIFSLILLCKLHFKSCYISAISHMHACCNRTTK